jgi:hypothetical protein
VTRRQALVVLGEIGVGPVEGAVRGGGDAVRLGDQLGKDIAPDKARQDGAALPAQSLPGAGDHGGEVRAVRPVDGITVKVDVDGGIRTGHGSPFLVVQAPAGTGVKVSYCGGRRG